MNKTFAVTHKGKGLRLFGLALFAAMLPAALNAQVYYYFFSSGSPTSGSVPVPPVDAISFDWVGTSVLACGPVSKFGVSPGGSGYSVTGLACKNDDVLTLTMKGPDGEVFTAPALSSTKITGPGNYPLTFGFDDPVTGVEEIFANATLSVLEKVYPPVVEWCELCQLNLVLNPGIPIEGVGEQVIEASVRFLSLAGEQIGPAQRVTLEAGRLQSIEFEPGQVAAGTTHLDLVPEVTVDSDLIEPPIQVTAELFDRNQNGILLISDPFAGPAFALAPQSVSNGQTMRLIARANSTDGCVATLGFKDAAGRLIGPHANVELKAGEVHVLDFNPDVPQNDKPLLLLPAVQTELKTATGAPVSSACLVTSEVFNFRTGIPGTYQEALIH